MSAREDLINMLQEDIGSMNSSGKFLQVIMRAFEEEGMPSATQLQQNVLFDGSFSFMEALFNEMTRAGATFVEQKLKLIP